ncbi:MAG: hypothetical protein IPO16_12865 [Saprospiraceae bacterium]|nr:hypothetical protein [Saprospiraceae bacterium]
MRFTSSFDFIWCGVACSKAKKTQDAGKANSINSQKIESPDTIGKIAKLVFDSTNYHFGT